MSVTYVATEDEHDKKGLNFHNTILRSDRKLKSVSFWQRADFNDCLRYDMTAFWVI